MKKIAISVVALLLFSGLFEGCKYEEGPFISFHSRKERVLNHWELNLLYEDEVDITAHHRGYFIEFWEDGTFRIDNVVNADTTVQLGYWEFQEDESQIFLFFTDPPTWPDRTDWVILKLNEKDLRVKEDRDSVEWEYQFLPAG